MSSANRTINSTLHLQRNFWGREVQYYPQRTHPQAKTLANVIDNLAVLLAVIIPALMLSPTLHAKEYQEWTGVWDTQWRGGGAVVEMRQDGDRVEGHYPGFEGVIRGRIEDNRLTGTWNDAAGAGVFTFVMSPDQQSFMGRFGTGEWWTGMRTNTDLVKTVFGALDQSSPDKTLYSFLRAGNRASEGRSDRLGVVMPLLDFGKHHDSLTPYDRIDLARLLFQIIDRLTFRIWELRPDRELAEGDYEVELTQADSRIPYTLTFRPAAQTDADGERAWRLLVPTEDQMRESLDTLLETQGGLVPHSRQHHELGSPRATMRTFIEQWSNVRIGNTDLFLETMDLSRISTAVREDEGVLLGEYLMEVLYRIGLPLRQEIPDTPSKRGVYTHFVHPAGVVEIAPFEQEDGTARWRFSSETMASARQLFMALEDMPLVNNNLRDSTSFFDIRNDVRSVHRKLLQETKAGMELWQWFALLLWLLLSVALSWLLTWLIAKPFQLKTAGDDHALSYGARFFWPLRLILISWLGLFALQTLGIPHKVDIPLRVVIGVTLSLAGGWLAYHLVDKVSEILEERSQQYRYRDEILRSLATSTAKLVVIIGAFLVLAEILSLPYQGVIAGLGIGGLAVALAARSTLENLIGGLTLLADKPVEVGDFCQLGEHLGVIEGIGLRSVKVRSLARTIITIPNAEFASLNIENLTRRDRVLLRSTLGLRYETTPDQLRWVLAEMRQLLLQHQMITAEPARVRFLGFGDHSVDVEIFAYVKTSDFNEFLAVQEDVYLRIIDIIEESGTGFAFPSMVNYLANDPGVDSERAGRAEAMMQQLRESNDLPFPEFDLQTRKKMRDTLHYPPEGSVDFEPHDDTSDPAGFSMDR